MRELLFQGNGDTLRLKLEGASEIGGSFEVSLEVTSQNFSGSQSQVHFFATDYTKFLKGLRELEETRQGAARLQAMSPNEFWMEVLAVDKLGHIHLQGKLTQESSLRSEALWNSIGFDIELDPTRLPRIIREFETFPGICPGVDG